MGEAVASDPKGTLRARRALGVVHTFFVRASDNPLRYDSGPRCVRLEEAYNLFANVEIFAYIDVALGEPAFEKIRLATFPEEDTDHDLGRQFVVGSIEGDRGDGIASKARPKFPVHPRAGKRVALAKSRLSLHPCNIPRVTPSCRKRNDFYVPLPPASVYAIAWLQQLREGLRQLPEGRSRRRALVAGSLFTPCDSNH